MCHQISPSGLSLKQNSANFRLGTDSSKYLVTEIKFEPVCLINVIGSSKFLFNEMKKHGWSLEAGSSQVQHFTSVNFTNRNY